MIDIQPIPAFSDNYIWLLVDRQAKTGVVVDPGDAGPVLEVLGEQGLSLTGILVTHHHFDHVGGLQALKEATGCEIFGPDNDAISLLDHRLRAGDEVEVLDTRFQVMEVPGHTLDHIAYYHAGEPPLLFCGDTLFAGGCGRVFEGTFPMMHQSLQSLAALPPATRVFCAHEYTLANLAFARAVEPDNRELADRLRRAEAARARGEPTVPSSLGLELATNPFLRCEDPGLQASLRTLGKLQGQTGDEVFATVRGWKDNF